MYSKRKVKSTTKTVWELKRVQNYKYTFLLVFSSLCPEHFIVQDYLSNIKTLSNQVLPVENSVVLCENNEKLIEDRSVDAVEKVGLDRQHDVQVPRGIISEKQNKIIIPNFDGQ